MLLEAHTTQTVFVHYNVKILLVPSWSFFAQSEVHALRLKWKNPSGLHRAPILSLTEHLRDEQDCWLYTRLPRPTSVLDLTEALWVNGQIPTDTLQKLLEIFSQNCKDHYNNKVWLNLEWNDHQAHMGVMVICPQTFGHIKYIQYWKLQIISWNEISVLACLKFWLPTEKISVQFHWKTHHLLCIANLSHINMHNFISV